MLFDVLPQYQHLGDYRVDSTSTTVMRAALQDFDGYTARLQALQSSLDAEYQNTISEHNRQLATLQDILRLEECRAEEEVFRLKAHAAPRLASTSIPFSLGISNGDDRATDEEERSESRPMKLTDFWRMKNSEMSREIELATQKRDAMQATLEEITASQSSGSVKTSKAITQLNEKILEHKQLGEKFCELIQALKSGGDNAAAAVSSLDPRSSASTTSKAHNSLGDLSEEGLQKVMERTKREGEALLRLANFLAKRESTLKYRVHKLTQRLAMSNPDNVVEDVLYLRAEVRTLREQQSLKTHEAVLNVENAREIRRSALCDDKEQQDATLEALRHQLVELDRKVREVRVAIIRTQHRSRDGSMIVKRAVDEQNVAALRERLAAVEDEKLHELQLSHEASLRAQFDASIVVYGDEPVM